MENNQIRLVQMHSVCIPNLHQSDIHIIFIFLKSPVDYADILTSNMSKSY